MANKVGKFHIHELPDKDGVALREDVFRCNCGTEYYLDEAKRSGIGVPDKEWKPVSEFPGGSPIHYDKTVEGKPFIGFATKETVFDEEVPDGGVTGTDDGRPAEDLQPTE